MKARMIGAAYVNVNVSAREVEDFMRRWPCSGLRGRALCFQFDTRNGDLVELWGARDDEDGPALVALSEDASNYAAKRFKMPQLERGA